MFTLKHIHMDGSEEIHQSTAVRYTPGTPSYISDDGRSGSTGTPATVWIDDANPITGGTVFVMGDSGKTVARYDLGASPVPIARDGLSDPRPIGPLGLAGANNANGAALGVRIR